MAAFGNTRTLGRYELLTELATSHLGPLWLGRVSSGDEAGHLATVRRVRLGAVPEQGVVDRISEAAWSALELEHELLSKVVEVLVQGPEIGVIQDYVEGVTLRTLQRSTGTRKRPVPLGVALRIVCDVLTGLADLHRHALDLGEVGADVFGGVSPDGILIATTGRALLLDPLVAGAVTTVPSLRDHSDRIPYTAPEQHDGSGPVDAASDVFTVGTLLWELVAERRLFMGMGRAVVQKVTSLKIPRLDQLDLKDRPAIPTALADVVAAALERDRRGRIGTARALLDALEATGLPAAEPSELTAFVEDVCEFEVRRQRDAVGGKSTKAPLHTRLKSVRPGRAAPPGPTALPRPPAHPRPDTADELPPPRPPKQTLLGIAPPKPHRGQKPDPSLPPDPGTAAPAGPAADWALAAPPPPDRSGAEAAPAVPAESEALELEDWEEVVSTRRDDAGRIAAGVLGIPPPPSDLAPSSPLPSDALDAELEAVYDDPVAVQMESMMPGALHVAPTPSVPIRGPGAPFQAVPPTTFDQPAPAAATASRTGEAPSGVASALADALSGLTPGAPPVTETSTVPLAAFGAAPPPGTAAPGTESLDPGTQRAASAPDGEAPAVVAVPLIHDPRFAGPGPRTPRKKASFWVGIAVGTATGTLIVGVIAAVALTALWGRHGTGDAGPRSAAPRTARSTPATTAPPPEASSLTPPPPPTPSATNQSTDAGANAGPPPTAPSSPPEVEPRPRPTAARPASPRPDATRPKPTTPTTPKPKPKPTYTPDEI